MGMALAVIFNFSRQKLTVSANLNQFIHGGMLCRNSVEGDAPLFVGPLHRYYHRDYP